MPILGTTPTVARATLPPGTRFGPSLVDVGPIAWGRVDSYGVEWHVEDLTGWDDTPPTVGVMTQKPDDVGAYLGPQTYGPRIMTLTGWIVAPSPTERDAARQRLTRALPVNGLAVVAVTDELGPTLPTRQCQARVSGEIKMARRGECLYAVQATIVAPDPRKYALNPTPVTIGLPTYAGGLVLPLTLPVTMPVRVSSGTALVTNVGDLASPWTARIVGPITTPGIRNVSTGAFLGVNIELTAEDWLLIDSRNRTVLLNGLASASRTALLTRGSSWWALPGDAASDIRLTSSILPGGGTPVVEFTPLSAWS